MAQKVSRTTTDHGTIRRWVEERGGWPAEVEATAGRGQTGIVRIDFPGFSGEGELKRISWDEWFAKFDHSNLALVYEDATADGRKSSLHELVAREAAEARKQGARTTPRKPVARRQASRAEAARTTRPRAGAKARKDTKSRSGSRSRSKAGSRSRSRPR